MSGQYTVQIKAVALTVTRLHPEANRVLCPENTPELTSIPVIIIIYNVQLLFSWNVFISASHARR